MPAQGVEDLREVDTSRGRGRPAPRRFLSDRDRDTPMGFSAEQIERLAPLWERMLSHRFLTDTRDGRIERDVFATWMRQDYLFVEAAVPFVAALLARAPVRHRDTLSRVLPALQKELAVFEERAAAVEVDLRGAPPSFTCHAYVQFLLATGHGASYEEAFAVLYGAEKCYHESWKVVAEGIDPDSRWQPFVHNWAGEEFAGWVAWLETEVDALAESAGREARERMARAFELTVLYEIAFWEMASTGEGWPGLEGVEGAGAGTGGGGAAAGSAGSTGAPESTGASAGAAEGGGGAAPASPGDHAWKDVLGEGDGGAADASAEVDR